MSESNVIDFPGETYLDLPVPQVLDGMKDAETVLVIGLDDKGDLCSAASTGDAQVLLWLIEKWKYALLSGAYD